MKFSHISDTHLGLIQYGLEEREQDIYNSFNQAMAFSMQKELDYCAQNDEIRTIIITGSGKAFCAGQDLAEATDPNGPELESIVRDHYNPIILKIRLLEKPVIAAVNGVAAGAGFSFVGFADMAIASSNATFVSAYSKIGLTPDGSSTYFLPRIIGARRYTELVLTNRVLSANEALDWGLINKVVDFNGLKDEAYNLAKKLAEGPSLAFGKLKNLVHNSFLDSLEGQMEYEARMIAESAKTKDGMNGIEAFVNKQPVSFKGQ